ncbi:MAG: glycine-rich domain-containing protein [Pseudomonadota bacterium]
MQPGFHQFPDYQQLVAHIIRSGTGKWLKPPGYDANDTILCRFWAAGGSGACGRGNIAASGGEGGSYLEIAYRYGDFPDSGADYSIGVGGDGKTRSSDGQTNGVDGGDTTVTIGGITFTVKGGQGGICDATTATTTPQTSSKVGTFETVGVAPYGAGNGGSGDLNTDTASDGGDAPFAGAGGAGAFVRTNPIHAGGDGGTSMHGGDGGDGASATLGGTATATAGEAPGGGGGAAVSSGGTANSGDGARGEIQFVLMRGWRPTLLSAA